VAKRLTLGFGSALDVEQRAGSWLLGNPNSSAHKCPLSPASPDSHAADEAPQRQLLTGHAGLLLFPEASELPSQTAPPVHRFS
jgi:hypothetical protein